MTEALIAALAPLPMVRLAVLFGSCARGAAGRDVDVGVRLCPDLPEHRFAVEAAIGRAVGRPVDLVLLDSTTPLLALEISRDGQPLIERDAHAWAEFRERAMIAWWDFAPTSRIMVEGSLRRLSQGGGRAA